MEVGQVLFNEDTYSTMVNCFERINQLILKLPVQQLLATITNICKRMTSDSSMMMINYLWVLLKR